LGVCAGHLNPKEIKQNVLLQTLWAAIGVLAAHNQLAALPYPIQHLFHLGFGQRAIRSEEHTSELQSRENLVCRLLLEKKKKKKNLKTVYSNRITTINPES